MWVEISVNDVKTRLAAAELAAYRSVALAAGQVDPISDITAQVVHDIRGYAAIHARLGAGMTIPDELLGAAVDMVAFRLTTRLGIAVKEDRRTAYQDALAKLRDLANGRFKVVPAETAAVAQAVSVAPAVQGRTRLFGDQDGV